MASHHHHHNNHHSTTTPCCCHHPPPPQQPPFDPFLISTIISQLQHQNPIKTPHFHPHSPSHSPPLIASLIRRLDHLETSLYNQPSSFSGSLKYPPFYLKDAAARVIQTRFRVFFVRRSRTLAHLKDLANVKSTFLCLKSLVSNNNNNIRRCFVDFDCVSRDAMDLLLLVDVIKGEDKMIRDSKKSITREIIQFLELIDGLCVKRHQVMTRKIRTMRVVRKDKGTSGYDIRGYSDRASGSKSRNVGNEEKKLIANLRERVERIGKMSRVLEEEEEDEDEVEDTDSEIYSQDDGGNFNHIRTKHGLNNGLSINKRTQHGVGSKGQNVDYEGKRIISNLKGRVERIGKLSRALEEAEEDEEEEVEVTDDESEGYEHLGDDNGGNFNHIRSKHGPNNAVSNSKRTTHHVGGSKGENVDGEGKRMIANLKERVERIAKMSRALEEEELVDEETEGIEYHGEEDGGNYNHINIKGDPRKGVTIKQSMPHSSGKRVGFVEDGNMTKGIQDSTTARQDEAEAPSDEEQSTQSSEVDGDNNHDKEFTFPAPEVPKRKSGVKIAG